MVKNVSIGIDLGTTNSCIAYCTDNKVTVFQNAAGSRITPSIVSYSSSEVRVGEIAKVSFLSNTDNTFYNAKKFMGLGVGDLTHDSETFLFGIKESLQEASIIPIAHVPLKNKNWPQEVTTILLQKLRETVERSIGRGVAIRDAVITVPVCFDQKQRAATVDAARNSGLRQVRLLSEPTAVAISYAAGNDTKERTILVFGLGGGNFDVSIIRIRGNIYEVLASDGDKNLGGENFTYNLIEYCLKKFKREEQLEHSIEISQRAYWNLKEKCEATKRTLSETLCSNIYVQDFYNNKDLSVEMNRSKFDELNKKLFEKCFRIMTMILKSVSLKPKDISEVVMFGGSSRIFEIQRRVKKVFGRNKVRFNANADESAACGAAIYARKIYNTNDKLEEPILKIIEKLPNNLDLVGNEEQEIVELSTSRRQALFVSSSSVVVSRPIRYANSISSSDSSINENKFEQYEDFVRLPVSENKSKHCKLKFNYQLVAGESLVSYFDNSSFTEATSCTTVAISDVEESSQPMSGNLDRNIKGLGLKSNQVKGVVRRMERGTTKIFKKLSRLIQKRDSQSK